MAGKISISNCSKSYSGKKALNQITCDLPKFGKVVGLIGPNGSGKSTLIKTLLGLMSVDSGEIKFSMDLKSTAVGYCAENSNLFDDLTVISNFKLLSRVRDSSNLDKIHNCLKRMSAEDYARKKFSELSFGERQKVKIAAAAFGESRLIVFDEPHNGLDPTGFVLFRKLIEELKEQGSIVLIASHLLNEVKILCDEVLMIANGSLIKHIDISNKQDHDLEEYFLEQ